MFKFPWYVYVAMLANILVSLIMSVCLLPYDISLTHFKQTGDDTNRSGLRLIITVLYWTTWITGWILMPVFVSIFQYNYALTPGKRVWYAIRHNIAWYLTAFIILICGIVLMLCTSGMKASDLPSLCIALSNAYGLLLYCLLVGYSLISLPRELWRTSNSKMRFRRYLYRISSEAEDLISAYADGNALQMVIPTVREKCNRIHRDLFYPMLDQREDQLKDLLGSPILPGEMLRTSSSNHAIQKFEAFEWEHCIKAELEEFLRVCDKIISSLKYKAAYVQSLADSTASGIFCFSMGSF